MTGGNEDHEDSMDNSDESDGFMESAEHSECDLSDVGDMEFFDDVNQYCSVHQNLKDDIRKALASFPDSEDELGIPSVQIDETRTGLKYISAVMLTFTFKEISEHLLQLWDLVDTPAIIIEMDNVHRGEFRAYGQLPTITVKKHSSEGHFIVGEQLKNFTLRLCRESYHRPSNDSPEVVGSFFRLVYGQVKERLLRLSEYCITCGERLSTGGVLPSICDRDLCMYQYSELHLFDGLSVPRVSPEVLSLLLFAFSNANLSARRSDILTPAPPIRDLKELLEEAKVKRTRKGDAGDAINYSSEQMTGSTYWNYTVTNAQIQNSKFVYSSTESATFAVLLENLPCPREFLASVSAFDQFRKEWPQMSDIVDWLVISNRSYLEKVPKPMSVDFLHTDNQYCFVSDTPAKQAEFDKLTAENGGKTRFFFHGSPLDNWHSIIRSGLKNMSGTKYQLVGAAYGKGIYLSPFLDFAIGYASRGPGSSVSRRMAQSATMTQDRPIRSDCKNTTCCPTERTEDLCCVALVEVVDCPEAYNEKTEEIFVVEADEWCSIRMLLLYRQSDIFKLHDQMDKSWSRGYMRSSSRHAMHSTRPATSAASLQQQMMQMQQMGQPPTMLTSVTATGAGGVAQTTAPAPPTTSSGLMSMMMNRFSAWTGGTGGPYRPTGVQPGPKQVVVMTGPVTKSKETKEAKAAERKKRKEERAVGRLMRAAAAAAVAVVPPPPPSNTPTDAADPTVADPAPATLGSTSTASSSAALVDLTKEDDDEDIMKFIAQSQPSTSIQRGDAENGKKKKQKKAEGESQSDEGEDDAWLYRREPSKRLKEKRERKEREDKIDKVMKKEKKKGKNLFKRKRSMSDSMPDVPKKRSSSPSNDKSESKLTEEDMKILVMFAESDLRDEVQITKVVPGKEEKKKKKTRAQDVTKKLEEDSDDEIKIVSTTAGKKMKQLKEKQQKLLDEILIDLRDIEKEKKKKEEEGKEEDDSASASPSTTAAVAADLAAAALNPTQPPAPYRLIPVQQPPPTGPGFMPLPPSAQGGLSSLRAAHEAQMRQKLASLQQQQQAMFMQHQQQQQMLQQHRMRAQQVMMQQQLSSSGINPATLPLPPPLMPPLPSSSGMQPTSGAPPPSFPPAGPSQSTVPPPVGLFQMMGSMLSRRRRRAGEVSGIPGDLTAITDEQREQIARVVRMFRNSGFEDRVNRHMNRDGEEKKEDTAGDNVDEEVVEDSSQHDSSFGM